MSNNNNKYRYYLRDWKNNKWEIHRFDGVYNDNNNQYGYFRDHNTPNEEIQGCFVEKELKSHIPKANYECFEITKEQANNICRQWYVIHKKKNKNNGV